ncbi:PilW family protein [Clostridium senegalense]|uniref:PilW family protein n=1 Tax=Clostridium senegalense TaxID=1465809 RepID=UPI000288DF26|nr:prepilin-type N-terminal cleavage/methylation domain-containing protein [Clostridium senegalense]
MKKIKNILLLKEFTKNKNKGFTLIEVLTSSFILVIILTVLCSLFISSNSIFFKNVKSNRKNQELEEAIYFIEYELERKPCEIKVFDNSIVLIFEDGKTKKIKCINNNLFILNSDNKEIPNDYGYKNYILKGVKKFKAKKIENLIYFKIETDDGKRSEKWHPIIK